MDDEVTHVYISLGHAQRALGYLGVWLAEGGYLSDDFPQPILLDQWAEALGATMELDDVPPSPIGAPPS